MANVELLKKTLQHVKEHPETWDQGAWCGTAQCFAGWAVALSGVRTRQLDETAYAEDMPAELAAAAEHYSDNNGRMTVRDAAVLLLDIGGLELRDAEEGENLSAAAVLFYSGNTLDDLTEMVAELCGETAEAGS